MDERENGMVEVEIEVDKQTYGEFCALCERQGLMPEEIIRQFFEWMASNPEEARAWFLQAGKELIPSEHP